MPALNKGRVQIDVDGDVKTNDLDAGDVAALGAILGPGDGPARVFKDEGSGATAIGRASGSLAAKHAAD